jgi:hypothetical protein
VHSDMESEEEKRPFLVRNSWRKWAIFWIVGFMRWDVMINC